MNNRLDLRGKLWLIALSILYTGIGTPSGIEIMWMGLLILLFLQARKEKMALRILGMYMIMWIGYLWLMPKVSSPFLLMGLSFICHGMRQMLPGVMIFVYIISTTDISEWLALFNRWTLPRVITVPLIVMIRFFPTLVHDYHKTRQAMALRGILLTPWSFIRRPLDTLEYVLTPILTNANHVSDDLTIAAMTKGLALPGKHTSILSLKWRWMDTLWMVLFHIPFILWKVGWL